MTLRERLDKLEPRERRLLTVLVGFLAVCLLLLVPIGLASVASSKRTENQEVRDRGDDAASRDDERVRGDVVELAPRQGVRTSHGRTMHLPHAHDLGLARRRESVAEPGDDTVPVGPALRRQDLRGAQGSVLLARHPVVLSRISASRLRPLYERRARPAEPGELRT